MFQFLVCTPNMYEVPGMNIINKFADSLELLVVNLNKRMCSRKPVSDS